MRGKNRPHRFMTLISCERNIRMEKKKMEQTLIRETSFLFRALRASSRLLMMFHRWWLVSYTTLTLSESREV